MALQRLLELPDRQVELALRPKRLSQTELSPHVPNFAMFAEACGAVGLRAEHPREVAAVIEQALSINDRPVLVEFKCDPEAMVFPMVPAGASNDEIILSREEFMSREDVS